MWLTTRHRIGVAMASRVRCDALIRKPRRTLRNGGQSTVRRADALVELGLCTWERTCGWEASLHNTVMGPRRRRVFDTQRFARDLGPLPLLRGNAPHQSTCHGSVAAKQAVLGT